MCCNYCKDFHNNNNNFNNVFQQKIRLPSIIIHIHNPQLRKIKFQKCIKCNKNQNKIICKEHIHTRLGHTHFSITREIKKNSLLSLINSLLES